MVGGAWPFLVGGAICLVNSDNERDSSLLISALVHCSCVSGVSAMLPISSAAVVRVRLRMRVAAVVVWAAGSAFASGYGANVFFLEGQAN